MKRFSILLQFILLVTASTPLLAQQGMGVGNANPLEMLDVTGAIKIGTDLNNGSGAPSGGAGTIRYRSGQFEGWNGSAWVPFNGSTVAGWTVLGNSGTNATSNFIGTTDNVDFRLRTNNIERLTVMASGTSINPRVGIGTNTVSVIPVGQSGLEIAGNVPQMVLNDLTGGAQDDFRILNGGGNVTFDNATTNVTIMSLGLVNNSNNVGIGTTTPDDKLHVVGKIRMVDGNQAAGRIPVSDANGTMTWTNPISVFNVLQDADMDTKVQVEESADEDIIRFDAAGSQLFSMRKLAAGSPWLEVNSSNTLIGNSISSAVNNSYNTAVGFQSAQNLTSGQKNTYFGDNAGGFNTNGSSNTMVGTVAGQFNNGGSTNTMIGGYAGRNNLTGSGNVFLGFAAGMDETGSNKLYIDNSNTTAPLIYGEFNNNIVGINGNLGVGTQTPATKLDVFNGDLQVGRTGNTSGSFIAIRGGKNGGSVPYNDAVTNALGRLDFRNTDIGSSNTEYVAASITSTNRPGSDDGDLRFYTTSDLVTTEAMNIDYTGNVGIGTIAAEKLHVVGKIRMVDGNQAAGKVMVSDANGTASWSNAASINILRDADNDTKIQVEESADEDKIRFDLAGSEKFVMDGPHLYVKNSGSSVFMGDNAGLNDDLSNNLNTFIGNQTGMANTTGSFNTVMGAGALKSSIAESYNTAIGWAAMELSTTANSNTVVGHYALHDNLSGDHNIAIGSRSLSDNTSGGQNTAIGYLSGEFNQGSRNVFIGHQAGQNEAGSDKLYIDNTNTASPLIYGDFSTNWVKINGRITPSQGVTDVDGNTKIQVEETSNEDKIRFDLAGSEKFVMDGPHLYVKNSGSSVFVGDNAGLNDDLSNNGNTFLGNQAGMANTSGGSNVAVGNGALKANTTASFNTAIGWDAMAAGTTANNSTALGHWSLHSNVDGSGNIALGSHTLSANVNGSSNTAVGISAGQSNTGNNNVFVGKESGRTNIGSGNVFLGSEAGENETGSNLLYIDNSNTASPLIYGNFSTNLVRVNGTLNINSAYSFPTTDGTANYVMKTNGSGVVSWVDPNSLIADDGDWTLSGSNVYNTAGGNVGVGLSSPATKLDVNGAAWFRSSTGSLPSSASKGVRIGFDTPTDAGLLFAYDYTNSVAKDLALQSNGANVGIGTTAPGEKLHVAGSIRMVDGNQAAGRIPVSNASGTMTWTDPATITTANDGDWTISGNNQYSAVSGNVGIGTTAPATKLHLEGSAIVNANGVSGEGITLRAGYQGRYHQSILAYDHSGSGAGFADGLAISGFDGIGFITNKTDNTYGNVRMFISQAGNVGIGSLTPNTPLFVEGNTTINANGVSGVGLTLRSGYAGRYHVGLNAYDHSGNGTGFADGLAVSGYDGISFITAKTDATYGNVRMLISQAGNVGIGTTAPADELHVVGNIRMVDGSQAAGYIPVSDANGTMTWTDPATISTASVNEIVDADNDTKVQVEETADEDIIRFDLAGTERWVMTGTRLEPSNSGNSVFIGSNAGSSDDLTANANVFIGNNAGRDNTTGSANVAIGASPLRSNNSSYNVAIGNSLMNSTTAYGTISIGHNSMNNSNGDYNVVLGTQAGANHTSGTQNVFIGSINVAQANVSGSNNIMMGAGSGQGNTGSQNVFLGVGTGSNNTGSGSVFLGHNAGKNEASGNRLYIENSLSATPLIYGEFDNDIVGINGNLGIGTQAPTEKLDILNGDLILSSNANGTSRTITMYGARTGGGTGLNSGTGFGILNFDNYDNNGTSTRYTGARIESQNQGAGANDGDMRFYTADNAILSEAMRIIDNGNIGMGTANPISKLHVVGNISMVDGNQSAGFIPVSDANGTMTWTNPTSIATASMTEITDSDNDTKIQVEESSDEDKIRFDTGGAERMIIDNSGNVGVGLTAPQRQLHIESTTGPQMLFTRNDNNTTDGEVMGEILFDNNDDTAPSSVDAAAVIRSTASGAQGNSNKGGNILFLTKNSQAGTTTATERMRIAANGYVGFGVSSPISSVDVNGTGWFRSNGGGGLGVSAGTGLRVFYDSPTDAGHIYGYDYASSTPKNLVLQQPGGNVGIGVVSPGEKLHVLGNTRVENGTLRLHSNDSYDKIQLTNAGTNGSKINHSTGWSVDYYAGPGSSATTGFHRFFTTDNGYSEKMRIASNGNVGIGTLSPAQKLHVFDSSQAGIQIQNSTSNSNHINLTNNSGFWHVSGPRSSSNDLNFYWNNGGFNLTMSLGSDGNVGIGNETPSAKLHVSGTGRFSSNLFMDDGSYILPTPGGSYARIGSGTNAFQDITTRYSYVSTAYSVSDEGMKKNIMPVKERIDAIEVLKNVQPKAFKWDLNKLYGEGAKPVCAADTAWRYGFVAQDIERLMPETVHRMEETGTLVMNYDAIVSVLFEATRQQQEIIEEERMARKSLEEKVQELINRLEQLETR